MPAELNISTYGKHFVEIKASKRENHPKLLQKTFLHHARNNKKKEYEDGKMWISWKLFYEKGGFAYIVFGVDANANKKFKVELAEKYFIPLWQRFWRVEFHVKKTSQRKRKNITWSYARIRRNRSCSSKEWRVRKDDVPTATTDWNGGDIEEEKMIQHE